MATGTIFLQQVQEELHAEDTHLRGSRSTTSENDTKRSRQTWTREEYKEVMETYYTASLNPTETSTTRAAYKIWRDKHASVRNYQM